MVTVVVGIIVLVLIQFFTILLLCYMICVCVCVFPYIILTTNLSESCSVVSDSATPWIVACQAFLSMEFSRPEYWSG